MSAHEDVMILYWCRHAMQKWCLSQCFNTGCIECREEDGHKLVCDIGRCMIQDAGARGRD